jgi:hypothetical protein
LGNWIHAKIQLPASLAVLNDCAFVWCHLVPSLVPASAVSSPFKCQPTLANSGF